MWVKSWRRGHPAAQSYCFWQQNRAWNAWKVARETIEITTLHSMQMTYIILYSVSVRIVITSGRRVPIMTIELSMISSDIFQFVNSPNKGQWRGTFLTPRKTHILRYSIHLPGWLQKWLNLITAPGSVSNEPGSVTWLATKYLKTVSWRNHTEKLTTWWPQNISFWPKINIPSSYFTILMLNCLENTLKLQFDSYVTAVRFLT